LKKPRKSRSVQALDAHILQAGKRRTAKDVRIADNSLHYQ